MSNLLNLEAHLIGILSAHLIFENNPDDIITMYISVCYLCWRYLFCFDKKM